MDAGEESFEVQLYIYDMAKRLDQGRSSLAVTDGATTPEIWTTGLIAYGREYYFWKGGIESCNPGETALGEPDQILPLGKTELPYSVFLEYILALGESSYRPESFEVFRHGSNTFTRDVAVLLTGQPTPAEFTEVPEALQDSELGKAVREYLQSVNLKVLGTKGLSFGGLLIPAMSTEPVNGRVAAEEEPPAAEAPAKAAKKAETSEKKKKKSPSPPQNGEVAAAPESTAPEGGPSGEPQSPRRTSDGIPREARSFSEDASSYLSSRRPRRYSDSPYVFNEVDGVVMIHKICDSVQDKLGPEESQALADLKEYVETENGAWALGNVHLDLLGRLLNDASLPAELPILTARFLQAAVLKEDIILLLHQDRRDHHLMTFFNSIETLPHDLQEAVGKLVCNLCQAANSFDWLMYISEWLDRRDKPCSNCRVTVRVAVHCLLAEQPPALRAVGAALMFNLALKELFDDSAAELSMAILQFLHGDLQEEEAFQCLTALLRFMSTSFSEVPSLAAMLGPDLHKFDKMSPRVDEVLQAIFPKLSGRH